MRTRADGRLAAVDLAGAAEDFRRVRRIAGPAGAPELVAAAYLGLGEIARRDGDPQRARELCERAIAECPSGWFGAEVVRLAALVTLGQLADAAGDTAAGPLPATGRSSPPASGRGTRRWWAAAADGWPGRCCVTAITSRRPVCSARRRRCWPAPARADAPAGTPTAATLRKHLGEAAFATAYARGADLPRQRALALVDGR
ncbi:tetratricopeptide repeat protein [Micromonospora sp. WMMB482]|uniref:tetratricopeptide repeat protein n=1 Tax=Micromonospora sp. WMMB482 TaxID=2849653 RepID=UPI0020B1C70C|nr:tetratricopeptide repeat protein [Micromonospora sp. WMMB482]